MECTQKLECTQELYPAQTERVCPEQIGFLGICGTKYPVKRGPNKIGRDPQTCNIVLNLNSISRQHAVINILNQNEFMLMDLDSANKTKLVDKTLQPYIPQPLKNGDTVQFGDIFGIFRLLEDDNDLPMTQAIDIPDTPIFTRHVSKLNHATTIPESPDISDKDDSFIGASQQRQQNKFKSSNHRFIKPSGKTIAIQPVGSNKIDNVYWNSSKKSASFNLQSDESRISLDDSSISLESDKSSVNQNKDINIHEMETQIPCNENSDSLHTANTQIPSEMSIHNLDTQIFVPNTENLPQICKINNQHEMQFDLFTANKENDKSIFNAETQLFTTDKEQLVSDKTNNIALDNNEISLDKRVKTSKEKVGESDEEILFDEIDHQTFEEEFQSQPLLTAEILFSDNNQEKSISKTMNEDIKLNSDNLVDCDDIDIVPSQGKTENPVDDDLTDCEDERVEIKSSNNMSGKDIQPVFDDDLTDCEDELIEQKINKDTKMDNISVEKYDPISFEDMPTQIIEVDEVNAESKDKSVDLNSKNIGLKITTQIINEDNLDDNANRKPTMDIGFEDMATQIIDDDNIENIVNIDSKKNIESAVSFEDMPTQIIEIEDASTQEFSEEIVSPFKIPIKSSIKLKRKNISKSATSISPLSKMPEAIDDHNYYAATQEIFEDLCSQRAVSPEIVRIVPDKNINNNSIKNYRSGSHSVDNYEVGGKFPRLDNDTSPKGQLLNSNTSFENSDDNERVNNYIAGLTSEQVRDVVGVNIQVGETHKKPNDVSDVDRTPKKNRPIKIKEIDLPSSQEIKKSISLHTKNSVTESSSESETETNSEEQNTPVLFRKKKQPKVEAKIDLTKKFDIDKLPSRVITRLRKPTSIIENSDEQTKRISKKILQPQYLTENEDNIDKDIIDENLSRLKSRNKKNKSNCDKIKSNENEKVKESQKEPKNDEVHKIDKSKRKTKETLQREKSKHNETRELKNSDSVLNSKKLTATLSPKGNTETIVSLVETKKNLRSTRSSRSKQKSVIEKDGKKSKSPEKCKSKRESKSSEKIEKNKDINNKHNKIESSSTNDILVRRSKRQKADKKEKNYSIVEKPKSILKKSKPVDLEQSTVYNISLGSSPDFSKNLKRSAGSDIRAPSPKRTRSALSSNCSLRSTPARTLRTQRVLFTAFSNDEVRNKLEKLGAIIETDVMACTVLVTLQVKRTFKLLCAVGLGRPIVGPNWVQACVDTNMIVDPWLYLIKDEQTEKRFHFSLQRTLTGKRNFLKGYNVSSTPSVRPSAPEMKLIVECSGGTWSEDCSRWVCLSTMSDKALWPSLRKRGATIVSAEFILKGVLTQKLDIAGNELH